MTYLEVAKNMALAIIIWYEEDTGLSFNEWLEMKKSEMNAPYQKGGKE